MQPGQRINVTLFDLSPHGGSTVTSTLPPPDVATANATGRQPSTGSHVTPPPQQRCAPGDLYATVTEAARPAPAADDEVRTSSSREICRSTVRRSAVMTSQSHVISVVLHVDKTRTRQRQGDGSQRQPKSKFIIMYEGLFSGGSSFVTRRNL